jgi:hypothetical protein
MLPSEPAPKNSTLQSQVRPNNPVVAAVRAGSLVDVPCVHDFELRGSPDAVVPSGAMMRSMRHREGAVRSFPSNLLQLLWVLG